MRPLVIRLGIVALVVVAAVVLRPLLAGGGADLKVGECFDVPSGTTTTVRDVRRHPCSDAHGGEVFFAGTLTGTNAAYPAETAVFDYVNASCVPAFKAYAGIDFVGQGTWDIGWFSPTEDAWKSGERAVSCYAYRLDGSTTTGSIKKS